VVLARVAGRRGDGIAAPTADDRDHQRDVADEVLVEMGEESSGHGFSVVVWVAAVVEQHNLPTDRCGRAEAEIPPR
jgi:hypothetical protein